MGVDINWNVLLQAKDPGMAFQAGFETSRNRLMQEQHQNALMQDRLETRQLQRQKLTQDTLESQQKQQAERMDRVAPLYAKARSLPYEQRRAFIQQAMPTLRQLGIPDEMVAAYDPTDERLDADLMVIGQQKQTAGPNIQKEVEYYRSIGKPELADQLLARHAEGPPIVFDVTGDGAPDLVPRSYFNQTAGSQAAPNATGGNETALRAQAAEAIANGADPAQVNARLQQMLGGAGSSTPRTFPGPN